MRIKAAKLKVGDRVYSDMFDEVFTVEKILDTNQGMIRFQVKERSGVLGISIHKDVKILQDVVTDAPVIRIAE
jgi:hypothetical protein